MNAPVTHSATLRAVDFGDSVELARIERFVAENGGSVFQRPLWLSAIAEGTSNQAHGIVVERGTTLSGWLPLTLVHSPLFGRALVSSGFGVGGGMLVSRERDVDLLAQAATELAQRLCVPSIELRHAVAPRDWDTIAGKHANFARDLAEDDEAQLLAIPRKARAEVRKGLANDLTITVGSSEQDRAAHYAVYAESVHNLGTPVFPRSLFDAVLDRFGADADILTVSHGGRPTASVLSLYHNGTVMPFWGGGTFAARGLRANERMYYELMLHARRKGCARFDFGRSKTGSGPFSFKKNWGFEPEPLVYRSWSAPGSEARNIDPTDAGYSAKIELWKRLPLTLANRIGPAIARGLG
ncbi:FemAB family PEP-CTERM system-associated protein [Qipengyuania sp. XHP0211]|uniref:FemAB family XrtA/PEP-CTERM system-associated protein n=1 Tax=Qipengyuania sp. XHP0211 TaxID=3038079 RepID=UPI00241D1A33|nr:FemAB family XrtA/PEP-CTERM system-associated protein [Qipengyuania sp. XHP0211]MDG5751142.1 FemAB family PEP-CTERM system-associated protein [Qipengyuania sp. XHP0211]